ncbi:hypothetical protein [Actinomycetospora callitridis]|uniref:hypothetical protein n=1 Tax=Actinomycetospora callitridis TaxID=913944 RepID=UPI002366A2E5|nr:hypothetical protein [Actinomycetospora callitridis]MDD7920068.1 hypothetical protein [Actinomycetospora callitridis]
MTEIRSWAVAALAVATLAVGLGAGTQIVRTSEAPVAPVVAVAPAAVPTTTDAAPPPTTPGAAAPPPTTTTTATTTATPPRSSTSRPTTTRSTRTSRTTVTAPRETADDEGPVASGPSAARAYRQCVRATNSPGPTVCRALVDAGVR